MQKQQNSLIAGLRATNEAILAPDPQLEDKKTITPDQECEIDVKENETKKQKLTIALPRSDSIGSTGGRKYLAPTLSDPSARQEKERMSTKKKNNRQPGIKMIYNRI